MNEIQLEIDDRTEARKEINNKIIENNDNTNSKQSLGTKLNEAQKLKDHLSIQMQKIVEEINEKKKNLKNSERLNPLGKLNF